jgi:hypothetical protein
MLDLALPPGLRRTRIADKVHIERHIVTPSIVTPSEAWRPIFFCASQSSSSPQDVPTRLLLTLIWTLF